MEPLHIVLIIAVIGQTYAAVVNWRQQRTIERLTDKLMAKDYNEYKRHERQVERKEEPKRKPLSYYDDGPLDTDEVN